ncbi:MAG TPA: hypothetical protein DET40_09330 [Lentisphaeria bacterium]|nr:MAG: hypothetical protein A2X45_08120 [Lentisphaerae bacterium GWF2_50_93]HCE43739.1 hypothetical protein [Lentisphaeria bacterium]
MKNDIKIVLIGAGSRDFARRVVNDIVLEKELVSAAGLHVVLVDIDEKRLKVMYNYARRVAEFKKSKVKFSAETDRKIALKGADFVITSVAVKRMELWEQDFRIPFSFGMKHVFGENGGPGALFHALRNYNIIIPICRDIERICPDATLINFTNPEARILTAILKLTKVRAVGMCHGFYGLIHKVCQVLGRKSEELDIRSAGMNHFFTYYRISDRKTGKDLRKEFEKRLAEKPELLGNDVSKHLFEKFGVVGIVSADHEGEYIGYAHELVEPRWLFGVENRKVFGWNRPIVAEDVYASWGSPHGFDVESFLKSEHCHYVDDYVTGKRKLDDKFVCPSGELAVPAIGDMVLDRKKWRNAVNVLNTGGYIANLAKDACVEVPAVFDKDGAHPETIGELPEGFAAMIRRQNAIQKLLVQAYAEKSKRLLLQALLLDPVVDSPSQAEKCLDLMLRLQADYLPELK